MRFRQHLCTEKAHYAQDCWDAEILTSYGWVECVGHADRACYDLTSHQAGSHKDLSCFELFEDGPREVDVIEMKLKKNIIGKTFGKLQKPLVEHLEHLSESEIVAFKEALDASGYVYILIVSVHHSSTKLICSIIVQLLLILKVHPIK